MEEIHTDRTSNQAECSTAGHNTQNKKRKSNIQLKISKAKRKATDPLSQEDNRNLTKRQRTAGLSPSSNLQTGTPRPTSPSIPNKPTNKRKGNYQPLNPFSKKRRGDDPLTISTSPSTDGARVPKRRRQTIEELMNVTLITRSDTTPAEQEAQYPLDTNSRRKTQTPRHNSSPGPPVSMTVPTTTTTVTETQQPPRLRQTTLFGSTPRTNIVSGRKNNSPRPRSRNQVVPTPKDKQKAEQRISVSRDNFLTNIIKVTSVLNLKKRKLNEETWQIDPITQYRKRKKQREPEYQEKCRAIQGWMPKEVIE